MTQEALSLRPAEADRLRDRATLVPVQPALLRLEGSGAVDCLQGVLTSDVVRPGPDSAIYGALLTVKGMIVVDLWALRDDLGFTLLVPEAGREAALALFHRQFPPRLARIKELTGDDAATVLEVYGAQAGSGLEQVGIPWPKGEGRVVRAQWEGHSLTVVRSWDAVPWRALLIAPPPARSSLIRGLVEVGVAPGTATHAEAARILAGWPVLGREIGEKTLPQEVRYDEIGGVSYTKGCYVGQETVARVHFRGHPNRVLRGLTWEREPAPPGTAIFSGDREVGRIASVLEVGEKRYGLALVRREVEPAATVRVGERITAVVQPLPFPPASLSS